MEGIGIGRWTRRTRLWACWGALALGESVACAQTGTLDPDFSIGVGVSGPYVHALAIASDGNILAGGNFTRVQGAPRYHVARFNVDGTLDSEFNPGTGVNGEVLAVACQADAKVLLGGVFTRVGITHRSHIARLNTDGTLDLGFDPGTGANASVRCLVVQPDGKILIAGEFTRYNGTTRNAIARLNTDGGLDADFNPGDGVGGHRFVDALCLQADGKILLAGDFASFNGVPRGSIARLNADGTLDHSFDPGTGAKPDDCVLGMAIQPDGKALVVGSFNAINKKPLSNLARLNVDGSLDSSFNPGSGTSGGPISGALTSVAIEPDGKILIGGWFDRVNGVPRSFLARLLSDGKPETNWNVRVDGQVRALAMQSDNQILIGGDFGRVNNLPSSRLARLNASELLPARLKACGKSNGAQVQLEFIGDPAGRYQLQTSQDLVHWHAWTNVEAGLGVYPLTEAEVLSSPRCFYRAVRQD